MEFKSDLYSSSQTTPRSRRGGAFGSAITSTAVIFKYNPHRMPPADVLNTFVGRDELLAQLIAHLRAQRGVSQPKHIFLHGPRGIGKTTILLVLRYKIAGNPGLKAAFDVVQFSEEERRVANLPSFAIRALELLAAVRPEVKADLEKARAAPEQALDILLEAGAKTTDRQVLFLLDNFDELAIAATSGKSKRFRDAQKAPLDEMDKFLTCPHFLVVATALQPPQKRKDFPKQFLEHFDPVVKLEPLTDAMDFLRKRAEKDRREKFLESLPRLAPRIEGLNRLADGNPRLLVFLYDCLGDKPLFDLVEIVQHTVDDLTPMYQDVIDRLLNRGQAAALEMLAARRGVGRAKDIAALTYQDEQTVRTFLGNLCDLGLVIRQDALDIPGSNEGNAARETVFRIHPPLFQIWYDMRHLGRDESLYLVRFFSLLTESEEARRVLGELQSYEDPTARARLGGLMQDVVDILDPEWAGIKKECVDEVIAKGGTLHDALAALDEVIAETTEKSARRKVGLLVVRNGVKRSLGDMVGAESDLKSADECLNASPEPATRAKLLTAWSALFEATGEYRRAVQCAEDAIELCIGLTSASAPEIHAAALLSLASAHHSLSDYQLALQMVEQADELLSAQDNSRLNAVADSLLGNIYNSLSDYERAKECHESALALSQDADDREGEAASLGNLGLVYDSLGDYERATEYFEKALEITQQIGNRNGEATSLGNLGTLYRSLGDYERALEYHEKALAIDQKIGNLEGEAASLNGLGLVYDFLGNYERALEYHEKALAIDQKIGNLRGEAVSLNNLGFVYDSLGNYERAREYYEKALAIDQQIGNRSGEAQSWSAFGMLALSKGEPEEALPYFRKAHELFVSLKKRPYIRQSATNTVKALFQLAASAVNNADVQRAEQLFAEALEFAADAGVQQFLAEFTNQMIIPCLQHSRELSSLLLPYVERVSKREEFADVEAELKPVEALLQFYASGQSRATLNGVNPTELFLLKALIDRVERPQHIQARELLESGKIAEARKVLEGIVESSPEDIEALSNLARALVVQGELDEAEERLKAILAQQQDFPPALLLLAQIEQGRGQNDRAIEILQDVLNQVPSQHEAYPLLAGVLRQQRRFDELAATLRRWRDATDEPAERQQLDILIPEAHVLAGDIAHTRAAMPREDFVPEDAPSQLLLGLLRTFLALHDKDAEAARQHAANTLKFASELPPGGVSDRLSPDFVERGKEHLGDREFEFFLGLAHAITQRVGPIEFANEFLSEAEVKELSERVAEEGQLALEALRSGRIHGFRDLFRTSTRSIGPAAGIAALGDTYQELVLGQKAILLDVFAEALKRGQPSEVTATLGALGKNFPNFEPPQRAQSLSALLELAAQSEAAKVSRERALRVLNILYPNLTESERQEVRQSLEKINEEMESPALVEFFNAIIPQIESEEKP